MSETDDTDVLLLIPPDFFLVHSSGSEDSVLDSSRTVVHKPSCTAQVLGKLVNQVHSLENRLESLELTTTSDTISSRAGHAKHKSWDYSESSVSAQRKYSTFPRRRRRKTVSNRKKIDLSLTSLDSLSTYDRRVPALKFCNTLKPSLNSESLVDDSPSMDGDISSIVSTPNKKNDKLLLHEIDEFLTKVESYESPESKQKSVVSDPRPENVIRATGSYLCQKLDVKEAADEVKLPSGRIVSSSVLDKYIYLVGNNPTTTTAQSENSANYETLNTTNFSKTDASSKLGKEPSKPATEFKSPKARKLNFSDTNNDIQPTSTPKKEGTYTARSYLDTFRPSSNKIYDRASKVLEQYKAQSYVRNPQHSSIDINYSVSPNKDEFKVPQRPYKLENEVSKTNVLQNKFIDTIDTDLLSLSELWAEKKEGDRVDSVKLEEERMKREHCEAMIQDLQKKLLEQQERIAVAVKVDRTKDAAITRLKDAWLRLTNSLEKAEHRHRAALDKMNREVNNFKAVADEAQKKTNHFEAELYKALDLAHDYQEKCKNLTSENKEFRDQFEKALESKDEIIKNKCKEIEFVKENYDTAMRLNRQSSDCVKNMEDALEKEKQDHESTKTKLSELYRKMQSQEEQMSIALQERDLLRQKVNEERSKGNILERQLADRQNEFGELLRKCDTQENELKSLKKNLELQKNELKNQYQRQLEEAVLSKLNEFQLQLDQAERQMESESRSKENAVMDTFNKQIIRIEEQHRLEINVLEEKHREETKLYRLQLAQASEKIGLLENKLESYRRRRGQLASELHHVMESQWRQALQILTNGHGSSRDITRNDTVSTPDVQDYVGKPSSSTHMQDYVGKPSSSALATPFTEHPVSYHRLNQDVRTNERMFNFEGLSDTELQQYVKLLLTKPANFHGGSGDADRRDFEEPTSDRPDPEKRERGKRSLGKPPWKA